MADEATGDLRPAAKPGLVFWIVAVLALPWNAFGAFDYTMSKLQGDAYLNSTGMTDAQITYFNSMPTWMTAVWAIGVWGGLLGSVLLILRSRHAAPVFLVSLAAFLMSLVHSYVLSDGMSVMGPQVMVMNGVILAGCLFFPWYAQRMTKAGVLR